MSEPSVVGAAAGAGMVASFGPVTHGYAYIVAGAVFGAAIALGEMSKLPLKRAAWSMFCSVGIASPIAIICAAAVTKWVGPTILGEFVTPQHLLAVVAVPLGWFFIDWRSKLRVISLFRKEE